MSGDYRRNHYVPCWYQRRFIPSGAKDNYLYRLDLKPGSFTDGRGIRHVKPSIFKAGPKKHFVETDLYTLKWGDLIVTDIEREYFGVIDSGAPGAVDHFSNYAHQVASNTADCFHKMMLHMSTQKLRTPKGLAAIKSKMRRAGATEKNNVLRAMHAMQNLHSVAWTEGVWAIADASRSSVKFIISDHPVTVYNREFGPSSDLCKGANDPDIWLNGSHTLYPLSMDKLLIITNLSWVRNPYVGARRPRPNPVPYRDTFMSYHDIQTGRVLSDEEVIQINFILKSRAYQYVAAPEESWLYPEKYVKKTDWARFGKGYLLMPDPRCVIWSTAYMFGFSNGGSLSFDEYGRMPGQKGFEGDERKGNGQNIFERFKGEFASLFGPERRGRTMSLGSLSPERDSEMMHAHHLRMARRGKEA